MLVWFMQLNNIQQYGVLLLATVAVFAVLTVRSRQQRRRI